jgi:hypothetical protein
MPAGEGLSVMRPEKIETRLSRIFSMLASRREFIAGAAAVGLTISRPNDLVAADTTADQAMIMAYGAFWGGALMYVEAEGNASPTDIASDLRFKPYNSDPNGPNDGHNGPNQLGKPHKPDSAKNKGPGSASGGKAREWLLWRVTNNFKTLVSQQQWNSQGPYVLSNCARMGVLALRNANDNGVGIVRWVDAFNAYYLVRDAPLRPQPIVIRNEWCV